MVGAETRSEIVKFFDKHPFGRNPRELVKSQALDLASDATRVENALRTSGMSSEELALTLIANVARELLASGRFHRYRGMLTMRGAGIGVVFTMALTTMLERGFITDEQFREHAREVAEDVKNVG